MTLWSSQTINIFCFVKSVVPARVDISLCDLFYFKWQEIALEEVTFWKTQIPHFLRYETGGKSHELLDINSLSHSTVYAVESQCSSQRCVATTYLNSNLPFNTLISLSIGFRLYLFAAYVFMNVMVVHLIKYVNFHSRMSNTNTQ